MSLFTCHLSLSMIGGVIVTHGQLATELVSAAEMIVGEIHHIMAVSIGWHDDVDVARQIRKERPQRRRKVHVGHYASVATRTDWIDGR